MKKVLALVLAVAMMATVAFAADLSAGKVVPGDALKIKVDGSYNTDDVTAVVTPVGFSTGDKLNTKNYSIKKVTYDEGKAYVESIVLNADEDEDQLKVTFKTDYTLEKNKPVDFTVELRGKGRGVVGGTIQVVTDINHAVTELSIDADNNVEDPALGINKVLGSQPVPYGTMEVNDIEGMADVSVRLYEKDKFFWSPNTDADKKVLIANADADAEISFLNFEGKPSFNSTATVYFYEVDEDGFVYELTGEGTIKKSAAKWSEDDGCWVLKTRTLGSYVFSDKALASAADATDSTTNPDTGANDVVGIATALAVVSLVAAGAVSLKK